MTTNVIDLKNGVSATDSRWSYQSSEFIIFIDNVGFEKIVSANGFAFTFAGNGKLIQDWKTWINMGRDGYPPVDPLIFGQPSIAVSIVNMKTNAVVMDWGISIRFPEAMFAGTGASQASVCWKQNCDAMKAVNSAMAVDKFSGGMVKHLVFGCGSNNLSETATIADVGRLLGTRGTVMYTNKPKMIPISEAVANDLNVSSAVGKLSTGEHVPTAPCDAMYSSWSDEDKEKMQAALREIFPEKFNQ
ncbi:hypothetical protein APT_02049 [Acetobacter pasteurianus NBRC 101655]|uniref:hypothetical protein n=1 Tax=Acetobacter pasteurianus TaxID=438 RepID=UPI000557F1F3|nr:hypothetical protein [Acetobacter pasteurianus]BAU39131.1 hypothetical protein APT_02049 [Acetobacter pasteurianus NBRC 101655]